MIPWQPQQQGLRALVVLLREAADPNNKEQALINNKLLYFHKIPDYNSYLAYILVQLNTEDIKTRTVAGLLLKNNIKDNFNTIPLHVLDYVKQSCIQLLNFPDQPPICKTVSSVIAAIVSRGQVHNWPQIIFILIEKLKVIDNALMLEISLDTLVMICEDAAPELDQEIQGIRPLSFMIPNLLLLYSNPEPRFRVQAINATSQFVLLKQTSFVEQLDRILTLIYTKMNDPNTQVRQELIRILTILLETYPQKMEPYLSITIEYMLNATSDNDQNIVLGACDFWLQYAHIDLYRNQLIPYLPRLVTSLLQQMIYSDSDLVDMNEIHQSVSRQKEDQSIRPRCYTRKNQSDNPSAINKNTDELSDLEEESDSDDDNSSCTSSSSSSSSSASSVHHQIVSDEDQDLEDDDFYSRDSPRQSSASALDLLSVTFGDYMANVLLDHLMNHTLGDENWLVRESGILALGAAAEGGINVIRNHLDKLIPFLLKSMGDSQPLVRSISCWAVTRFSNWLVHEHKATGFFEPVLFGLLNRFLDSNKRVQESACTAFIVLGEIASTKLVPYIYPILTHTNRAFAIYKRKNRLFLYDAMGTLADAVKFELNQPQFICLLMPPLITKWNELSDKDTDLFPLLECLSNITAALGKGFVQYVDPVLSRCVKLILSTLQEQMMADQYPDEIKPPNVEFLIAALDLLSGIVQGMGSTIETLIAQTNPPLLALLSKCIQDPVPEVLQSTFALLGDIAIASFDLLVPYIHNIFQEMIRILHNHEYIIPISVYNNVLWALGEMVMRWNATQVQGYIPNLIEVLFPLLIHPNVPASIHENAMISLGRLALASPTHVAPYLKRFIKPWLEKSLSVREGEEKETAFRGLCAIIKLNAQDAHDELNLLLVSISTWRTPSQPLLIDLNDVVKGYHHLLSGNEWENAFDQLDPEAQKQISRILTL